MWVSIPVCHVAQKWGRCLDWVRCVGTKSKNGNSFKCQSAGFLSLCLNVVSTVIPSFLTPVPSLSPSTSAVSGVLDSRCSDQWAPVVLGSLPLLDHQSCTNLHNSPPRALTSSILSPQDWNTLPHTHIHNCPKCLEAGSLSFMLVA